MVNEKLLYKGAILSYNANNTEDLSDNFKLRINSPTIDAYVNDNTKQIIISIRGTKINDINDIKADISLPFNKLHNTNRFNTDLNIMNKVVNMYDPKVYDYYMTSHSLGNAIMNEFMRRFPFVKGSIGYNGAFQTKDLKSNNPNIKRMYIDKDPLYRKGGYLFDPKVVLQFKSKSFFDWFFNRISGVKEAISAHSLKSFEDHYKGKGKDIRNIISKVLSYKGGCACCEKHKGKGRKIISRTPLKTKKRDKRRSYVERISRLK